jgi:hypothetical protein
MVRLAAAGCLVSGAVAATPLPVQISFGQKALQTARQLLPPEQRPAPGDIVVHPSLMTPLTPNGPFPRFSAEQLAAAGYPDHMHAFYWQGWTPAEDSDGKTYGPGSMCQQGRLLSREGLEFGPGRLDYGHFTLHYPAEYPGSPCDMVRFVELCDMARIRVRDLLELERDGRLAVLSPPNGDEYTRLTGLGVWRTYALDGDSCVVEPVPILTGRTLVGHAAVELVTRWTLHGTLPQPLPPWLERGLAGYLADMGSHLLNYMAEFRYQGVGMVGRARADSILTAPPAADVAADRQDYRRALYTSFTMVWRLIEDRGGLPACRRFLATVAGGTDADAAARAVYGMDLDSLARELDPTVAGDPLGKAATEMPYGPEGSKRAHVDPARFLKLMEKSGS